VTKLRNKYKPYEAKRLLCASYDLFLADDRVLPLLPKLLGKEFYKKKKYFERDLLFPNVSIPVFRIPTPIDLASPKKLKEEIETAISSAYLFLASGPCQYGFL
jgi:ribosome biogenesis protein UTP30